jgi:hypothetical protein
MAILDDLKGILSPEEFAKLEGNAGVKAKLDKANELYGWYISDDDEPPAATTTTTTTTQPAAAVTQQATSPFDLKAIERMLDAKLGSVNQMIESKLTETVTSRGNELVNNAVKISLQRADELNRIYARHQADYGEAFDSAKFNEYLEANKDAGYKSITQAYEAWTSPRATEKEVEKRVTAKLAERSGQHLPGTTPGPGSNKTIEIFRKRGTAAEGGQLTGAQKAAALLDAKMAAGA